MSDLAYLIDVLYQKGRALQSDGIYDADVSAVRDMLHMYATARKIIPEQVCDNHLNGDYLFANFLKRFAKVAYLMFDSKPDFFDDEDARILYNLHMHAIKLYGDSVPALKARHVIMARAHLYGYAAQLLLKSADSDIPTLERVFDNFRNAIFIQEKYVALLPDYIGRRDINPKHLKTLFAYRSQAAKVAKSLFDISGDKLWEERALAMGGKTNLRA